MAFANLITLRDYLSSTFHVPKSLLMSYAEAEAIALKFGIKPVFERK